MTTVVDYTPIVDLAREVVEVGEKNATETGSHSPLSVPYLVLALQSLQCGIDELLKEGLEDHAKIMEGLLILFRAVIRK